MADRMQFLTSANHLDSGWGAKVAYSPRQSSIHTHQHSKRPPLGAWTALRLTTQDAGGTPYSLKSPSSSEDSPPARFQPLLTLQL